MIGLLSACCARAASDHVGHAAETVIALMKSRRRIALPEAQTARLGFAITAGICDRRKGGSAVSLHSNKPEPSMSALG